MPTNNIGITKAVFETCTIESSSDFIVTAYEVCKRINPELMRQFCSVYGIEYDNFNYSSEKNITHFVNKIMSMNYITFDQLILAYNSLINYMTTDFDILELFPINEFIGGKIYYEMCEKRDYCLTNRK